MNDYIENPKTKDSGIICCIPQTGTCPVKCDDCFFQSGRSYLEPLDKNLPNIPSVKYALGRVVRMNDGNDSNVERCKVLCVAGAYEDAFFNTSFPNRIDNYTGPVVLTVNPSEMTDRIFHKVEPSDNLMFVRIRANTWNPSLIEEAIDYYTSDIFTTPVVLTFMAYYNETIPEAHKEFYEFKKRTLNSYWVITNRARKTIERRYENNPLVYSCGYKGTHACKDCGNCLREYYSTKERLREKDENV